MNLSDLHRRLLSDVLAIGTPYPLGITGGYAVQAHGLVDRLSQDLDVATENPAPMAEITRTLIAGLAERGWQVTEVGVDPLSGRLVVTDPASGEQCEADILKEAFWRPPTVTEYGPVLPLDDVIGTKVRALGGVPEAEGRGVALVVGAGTDRRTGVAVRTCMRRRRMVWFR
ncbi:hypothetical protein SHXM_09320 [Streptomyces hygroscopicus]|nr:hypothetical protein SHXM_09320 [Streptomyces hygroscopicus]